MMDPWPCGYRISLRTMQSQMIQKSELMTPWYFNATEVSWATLKDSKLPIRLGDPSPTV